MRRTYLYTLIIMLLGLVLLAGCGDTAAPTTETEDTAVAETAPDQVVVARDAVLEFIRTGNIVMVPPDIVPWAVQPGTDNAPDGFGVYRFTAENTTVTISYPETVDAMYNVALTTTDIGYCWQAVVDSKGHIVKTGNAAQMEPGDGNPASLYCTAQGYDYQVRTNEDGSLCGVCVFPDETYCKGWDYFYGDCTAGENMLEEMP